MKFTEKQFTLLSLFVFFIFLIIIPFFSGYDRISIKVLLFFLGVICFLGIIFLYRKFLSNFLIENIKNNWFKILGIGMLLFALGNQPYVYYQILKWAIMLISGYSAYLANQHKNITWVWIFSFMAILFNPIIPFIFLKDTWQIIDIILSIMIFVNIMIFNRIKR